MSQHRLAGVTFAATGAHMLGSDPEICGSDPQICGSDPETGARTARIEVQWCQDFGERPGSLARPGYPGGLFRGTGRLHRFSAVP